MIRLPAGLTLLALAAAFAAPLAAQTSRPEFTIAVGPTIPTGRFNDHNPTGYNVTAGLGVHPGGSPLGFRLEGLYNAFNGRANYTLLCANGSADCSRRAYVTAATLNLTYDRLLPYNGRPGALHRGGTSTLYVIGGVGLYRLHQPSDTVYVNNPGGPTFGGLQFRNRSVLGWNVGGGLRIPVGRIAVYAEARLHMVDANAAQLVPVSIGIVF